MRKKNVCGNFDCREFGKNIRGGRCARCGTTAITRKEYNQWYDLLTAPSSDDGSEWKGVTITKENKSKELTFSCPAALTGCPIAVEPKVYMPFTLYNECLWLARQLDTEWLAYLTGEKTKEGDYRIEDGLHFPKQKATGAHVSVADGERVPDRCIAAIHSHVGMDTFFSQEDEQHFNHPVELVVNNKGSILANAVSTLKCGSLHRGKAQVFLSDAPTAQLDELKGVLTKETAVSVKSDSGGTRREVTPYSFSYIKH